MYLFRISTELQFGTCTHSEPCSSAHPARKGDAFIEGKRKLREPQSANTQGFSLAESLPRKSISFSFYLSDCIVLVGHESFLLVSYLTEVSVFWFLFLFLFFTARSHFLFLLSKFRASSNRKTLHISVPSVAIN